MTEEVKALEESLKIISTLTANQPNEYLPIIATAIGAVVGAVASFASMYCLDRRKDKLKTESLHASLKSEISAHLKVFKYRKYEKTIEKYIESLKNRPAGSKEIFFVQVPDHYSRVYQANCSAIGLIQKEAAEDIVMYHQLIDSVIQDVKPGGLIAQGGTLEQFVQLEKILSKALKLAQRIT